MNDAEVMANTEASRVVVNSPQPAESHAGQLEVLREIEDRVLWSSTAMVNHANRVGRTRPG